MLGAISVTRGTLPQIVARVRDVKSDVRCAAFEVIGQHVVVDQLR